MVGLNGLSTFQEVLGKFSGSFQEVLGKFSGSFAKVLGKYLESLVVSQCIDGFIFD